MLTNAVCVEESTVWEGVSDEVKERLCVLARNVVMANAYYNSKVPLLRNLIAILQNIPFLADDDHLQQSEVNIVFARGVLAFHSGSDRPSYQDPGQPDQATAKLDKAEVAKEKASQKEAARVEQERKKQQKQQQMLEEERLFQLYQGRLLKEKQQTFTGTGAT
jgi:hypothetical protein